MRYAIEVNHLTVDYGHVRALTDINMKVEVNEFLAIIGPNGGGKSTLLKALLGLIKPTSGTIRIMGMPSHKASGLIGYVPQFLKFDKHFPIRVMDVVLMGRLKGGRTLFHRYSGRDREIARQMLKRLEIEHLENRQIGQLSGGQLQRVLIARALAVQPKILMLDEPTASVDSHSKSHIYEILQELNKDMTIILVTHDTNVVSTYVKTIACLNERLFYHGNTELDDQVMEEVYGCPVEIIAHGVPHRVLKEHKGVKE